MNNPTPPNPEQWLQHQVEEYRKRHPDYVAYAGALKRVLEKACHAAYPDAMVQTRAKTISSFAEKCVRKKEKYADPVNQLSDLCGGRIIVQTLDQVDAVCRFMEAHFEILESDQKSKRLGADRFGYRDMHYVVRVASEKASQLGFTAEDVASIGSKRAEIQVRTWVQHAWADTVHDRIYKAKLKLPAEFRRTEALLAAIMEDGDRAFNRLVADIDRMQANFHAHASRAEVERELGILKLLLAGADEHKKPEVALRIAVIESARGGFERVASLLAPYVDLDRQPGHAIRMEMGYALCQNHRHEPGSDSYQKGLDLLLRTARDLEGPGTEGVADSHQRIGMQARIQARLAWCHEARREESGLARDCYRRALELEPGNPYYLADVVGHEIQYVRRKDFIGVMAFSLRQAIATCRGHLLHGTEMPYAAFTAGRLHLLLNEPDAALAAYARGICDVLSCHSCVPASVFEAERHWLWLVTEPEPLAAGYLWARELLDLASRIQAVRMGAAQSPGASGRQPVLIVAGGAASLTPEQIEQFRPLLAESLADFSGTVYSGGTRSGVPGCVGDAAEQAGPPSRRSFRLIGYLPRTRPGDAVEDTRYDERIECGEAGFTPEQILRNWKDILDAGIAPERVRLLGYGGGPISALEYRVALALGATAGLIEDSGGAVPELIHDPVWADVPRLLPLPCDRASVRAFVQSAPAETPFRLEETAVEQMARAFHESYVAQSQGRLPENMKPWEQLADTYKTANREQARSATRIIDACGFEVHPANSAGDVAGLDGFTADEVERMAELEHGRWNVERLQNGWRPGSVRDDTGKIHDCIVPWEQLRGRLEPIREYDRRAVRVFPEILKQAGLVITRASSKGPATG